MNGLQKPTRRKTLRLANYDYSQNGAYFITICAHDRRQCFFGEIRDGQMVLTDAGKMVHSIWNELASNYTGVIIDTFQVMPNHIHGIILLDDSQSSRRGEPCVRLEPCVHPQTGDHKDRPYGEIPQKTPHGTLPGTIGRIVQAFKSKAANAYARGVRQFGWPTFDGKLWQRNYYEHVIRNARSLVAIEEYIIQNPKKWDLDRENPFRKS